MSKLKVFLSDSFNPYLNIATEEWIFHNLEPSTQILYLWRNQETVVIGRNQNPWSECNLAKMKDDKVFLARRTTGGGAVFHDLGNTCFTFLSPRHEYKRENNVAVILGALRTLGIEGEASGRNDLLIPFEDGPRKFSGSAYREKNDRAFHHGTLLLKADLNKLGQYLTPNPKKLKAKGKESVRARVVNLSDVVPGLDHAKIQEIMIDSFQKFYGAAAEIETLNMESLKRIPELNAQYENLSSFPWLYGHTLEFNQEMNEYLSLGFFDFKFKVEKAVITDLQVFSDCLHPQLIEDVTTALRGQRFVGAAFHEAFKSLQKKWIDLASGLDELESWLVAQVEI